MEINKNIPSFSNQKGIQDTGKETNVAVKGTDADVKNVKQDEYIAGGKVEEKAAYDKPKVDQATIQKLKQESDVAHNNLRRMVEELLKRQGMTFRDLEMGAELEVDEIARIEAQGLIGEGGDLSPENVSDRIVEFAKALSGDDKGKFELLKGAIEEGFRQAAQVLGGELPEVSQRTYDLVMEKLNQWQGEE